MVSAGVGALLIIGTFKRRAPDPDFKVNFHVLPPIFHYNTNIILYSYEYG